MDFLSQLILCLHLFQWCRGMIWGFLSHTLALHRVQCSPHGEEDGRDEVSALRDSYPWCYGWVFTMVSTWPHADDCARPENVSVSLQAALTQTNAFFSPAWWSAFSSALIQEWENNILYTFELAFYCLQMQCLNYIATNAEFMWVQS